MSDRDLDKLKQALMLTLSVPVKPGAVHRLRLDALFEARLSEAVVLTRYMEEAYEKGVQLAKGSVDTKSLGLGKLYSQAVIDAFDFVGKRPLPGLFYSGIMLSVVAGYSSETGKDVITEANKLVRLVPYGSDVEDTLALIEGLEGVGASDHLLALDQQGISKRSVRLHALSIGDVAEKLSSIDKGFLYNLRGYGLLKETANSLLTCSNLVEAILRAYYYLGVKMEIFKRINEGTSLMRYFMELDRGEYKKRYDNDQLLGAVLFVAGLVHLRKSLPLP
ncbi:MAG: hypothetical protein GXO68_05385 [Crenarchaeota archaeon]|nr:hypothetical protein [Thermoproteota archaeon]